MGPYGRTSWWMRVYCVSLFLPQVFTSFLFQSPALLEWEEVCLLRLLYQIITSVRLAVRKLASPHSIQASLSCFGEWLFFFDLTMKRYSLPIQRQYCPTSHASEYSLPQYLSEVSWYSETQTSVHGLLQYSSHLKTSSLLISLDKLSIPRTSKEKTS